MFTRFSCDKLYIVTYLKRHFDVANHLHRLWPAGVFAQVLQRLRYEHTLSVKTRQTVTHGDPVDKDMTNKATFYAG